MLVKRKPGRKKQFQDGPLKKDPQFDWWKLKRKMMANHASYLAIVVMRNEFLRWPRRKYDIL